jgi:formyl-CoA transferase
VPAGRVYDPEDIVNDAHYAARKMVETWRLPDGRPIKIPAVVPKLSDTPGGTRWLGPTLGEHNAEILERLGYSADEQKALKERGVI